LAKLIHFDSFAHLATFEKNMSNLQEAMYNTKIPKHIAIIMDGNGRWAQQYGKERSFGHENGVQSVREALEGCIEKGVKFLTLYAFSTENWDRPQDEISSLMELLVSSIDAEIPTMIKHNIKLITLGDLSSLKPEVEDRIRLAINRTSHCDGLNLVVALSYSGRWDITMAVKKISEQIALHKLQLSDITESTISNYLSTAGIPDPELLIRTSGELRISNFLLWQMAYTELYFTPVLWPDFKKEHLFSAIEEFARRERRFGKTGEQLTNN